MSRRTPMVGESRFTRPRLVAFDLDGTLTRGLSCVEATAARYGFATEMAHWLRLRTRPDIQRTRGELWDRLRDLTPAEICAPLATISLAPGAADGIAALRAANVRSVIVSLALTQHAAWFATLLGIDHHIGYDPHGAAGAQLVCAEDKPVQLAAYAGTLGLTLAEVAAVGDSTGDAAMLAATGTSVFVGQELPAGIVPTKHFPDARIDAVVQWLLDPR